MSTVESINRVEALLWSTLYAFEELAQRQYRRHAPELLCDAKTNFIQKLAAQSGPTSLLAESAIGASIEHLLDHAMGPDNLATLNIQGLLLERLGLVIYRLAAEGTGMSEEGKELAEQGIHASSQVLDRVPALLKQEAPGGASLLAAFEMTTPEVIQGLDGLGEGVDQEFSEPLGIAYSDVMGEFAFELLEACAELGMPRSRLVVYLTSQLMGH